MPLCHIASLPLVNSAVSKLGVPPMSATVGIVVPGLLVSHCAASTPSGELNAAWPASSKNAPPDCSSAL